MGRIRRPPVGDPASESGETIGRMRAASTFRRRNVPLSGPLECGAHVVLTARGLAPPPLPTRTNRCLWVCHPYLLGRTTCSVPSLRTAPPRPEPWIPAHTRRDHRALDMPRLRNPHPYSPHRAAAPRAGSPPATFSFSPHLSRSAAGLKPRKHTARTAPREGRARPALGYGCVPDS